MESNDLQLIGINKVSELFIDYFAKFNVNIIHHKDSATLNHGKEAPYAILIHWSILKNNMSLLTDFYNQYLVPILVVNDFIDEETCVLALEAGADDFLVEPLNPRALHARITAISRRVHSIAQKNRPEKYTLTFANWRLLPASRQLFDEHNREIFLSAGEYDLLLTFVQRPQRILDREFLLQMTKHSELGPLDRRIDIQISRLRQKIEVDPKKPSLIKTIRNNGYLLTSAVIKRQMSDTED